MAVPEIVAIELNFSGHALFDLEEQDRDSVVEFDITGYGRDAFPDGELSVELIETRSSYPPSWLGKQWRRAETGVGIQGVAALWLELAKFNGEETSDWSNDYLRYRIAVGKLAEAAIVLKVQQLVARELALQTFPRSIPIIVGTHDFASYNPVVHLAWSA